MERKLPPPGVFIDTQEHIRKAFNYRGTAFEALLQLAKANRVSVLMTDVTAAEIRRHIADEIATALGVLGGRKLASLKAIPDARFDGLRKPMPEADARKALLAEFDNYFAAAGTSHLGVDEIKPSEIFKEFFASKPPFDDQKKKSEFPDAFALARVLLWAKTEARKVYVVSDDDDFRRYCEANDELEHFGSLEELLDRINREDVLVKAFEASEKEVIAKVTEHVESNFGTLGFALKFNPHGSVSEVSVRDVEVTDVYVLSITKDQIVVEASVHVCFEAEFEYDDMDTASYDSEDKVLMPWRTISGESDDCADVDVEVTLTISPKKPNHAVVAKIELPFTTITVKEEDRGDYDAYK